MTKLESPLTRQAFEEKLRSLTTDESEIHFLLPFDFSGKPFQGTFDHSTFDLVRNSVWRHVRAFVIRGKYETNSEETTTVTYTVDLTKFHHNFRKLSFVVALAGLNIFLYADPDKVTLPIILTLNGFVVFVGLCTVIVNKITRKIVDERFRTEFEIGTVNKEDSIPVNYNN